MASAQEHSTTESSQQSTHDSTSTTTESSSPSRDGKQPTITLVTPSSENSDRHELQTPWTFWYDKKLPKEQSTTSNYADNLRKIGEFSTIEGFWRTFVFLLKPLDMPKDTNYHMFRGEVPPMWENFPNGGCWFLKLKKKNADLTRYWEELVFSAIGEVFEEPDVVGVVLSTRTKYDIVSIWNTDAADSSLRVRMSEKIKRILHLDSGVTVEYKAHSLSMKDQSTYRNGKAVFSQESQDGPKQPQEKEEKAKKKKEKKNKKKKKEQMKHQEAGEVKKVTENKPRSNSQPSASEKDGPAKHASSQQQQQQPQEAQKSEKDSTQSPPS